MKKRSIIFLTAVILFSIIASAQKNSGRSKPMRISHPSQNEQRITVPEVVEEKKIETMTLTKESKDIEIPASEKVQVESEKLPEFSPAENPKYMTPFLEARIIYTDPSGNNFLDAEEEWIIDIRLKNIGNMPAKTCDVKIIQEPVNPNINIGITPTFNIIQTGEEKSFTVKLLADNQIKNGKSKLILKVLEQKGFDLYPEKVMIIRTREFQPPLLEIVDYSVDDLSRNAKIERFEAVDVIFRIQNRGETPAYETKAVIELGDQILPMELEPVYELGTLTSGEYRDVRAKIAPNSRATEVKINVTVQEKTKKYGTFSNYILPFDVVQKKPDELEIEPVIYKSSDLPELASMGLDIAENIPSAKSKNPNGVAVIIGNKNYEKAQNVDFAINDAKIVKNYVVNAMGYDETNLIYLPDAKQSNFRAIFGDEQNYKGTLHSYLKKGIGEAFIYYSGHGAPDLNSGSGFIVPVDGDPNLVSLTGYSLQTLITNLQKIAEDLQLKHITLVIDACFSGNFERGNLIADASLAYSLKDETYSTGDKVTVITSASGGQISSWYPEKKQSLFTYVFLKGLQGDADFDGDGTITAKEVYQYTIDDINGVPYLARRLYNGRIQTPKFSGTDCDIIK